MPRRKKQHPKPEIPVDFTALGFDPNTLLGSDVPRGPMNFEACLHFARQGLVYHMNRVASYYEEGESVARNLERAAYWYGKAADRGNRHAMRKMGDYFRNGIWFEKNPARAFEYYYLAAATDWAPALFELGQCYEKGIGCPVNPEKAIELYRKAAEAKNKNAIERLEEIKRAHTVETIKLAIESKGKTSPEKTLAESDSNEIEGEEELDEEDFPYDDDGDSGDDDITVEVDGADSHGYVGQCCFRSTVSGFLNTDKHDWFRQMCTNHGRVTNHPLNERQKRAWRDCRRNLVPVLNRLCSANPRFGRLGLVFEYVMPCRRPPFDDLASDPGRRADVVLVSTEAIVCMEFKQYNRRDVWPGTIHEGRMYPRKIRRYHLESVGKTKRGVVVLTNDHGYDISMQRLRICSPDKLAGAIQDWFHHRPAPVPDLDAWLASEWRDIHGKHV